MTFEDALPMEDFFEVLYNPRECWTECPAGAESLGHTNQLSNHPTTQLMCDSLFFHPPQVVDHHFEIRLRMGELRKSLEDRAVQFRNIEKRLLMRFKVRRGGWQHDNC